jgi:phosphatidylglycerophosphate synthase
MLDGVLRRMVDPLIETSAAAFVRAGVSATALTLVGLAAGLAAAAFIALGSGAVPALVCLFLSRAADGLDGAVARRTRPTALGAFLDIVCDFIFYGAIPLAFALLDPLANALPAAVLLFAFYVNGASFLAYAAIAAGKGMRTEKRGQKGLYYTAGLAEGSETIACFALMMLWPSVFIWLAYGFAVLCLVTASARIVLAAQNFRD